MSYKIKNKHLDLLAAYNRNDEPSHVIQTLKYMIAPGVLILIFGIVFATMTLMTLNKKNELKTVNEEMEVIQLKIDSTDHSPYEELNQMETSYSSIEALDKSLSSLAELTKDKIMYLKSDLFTGVSIKTISFSQASNELNVSLTSSNVQNIEKYITRLKQHNDYTAIDYTGYQESSSSQTNDTGLLDGDGLPEVSTTMTSFYSFSLKITLAGKVGE